MTLFDDMSPVEKVDHCERCIKDAKTHLDAEHGPVYLADILDVWDYWAPYLIERVRKLEVVAEATQRFERRLKPIEKRALGEDALDDLGDVREAIDALRVK